MKKYLPSIVFIFLGLASFFLYSLPPSYVGKDGILVESFGYIPVGFFFIVIGFVSGLSVSTWKLFHTPKTLDRWMFGISATFCAFFVSYVVTGLILANLE
jgi:hypothetical protein